eukprot:TRINITY_DN6680_c0_g1_i2.p1 TRINITY_DN6680_c0_g1~~TRINITY_DN6680_c0_g1_i2.p1  ORF type:complete len:344 (+),score=100.75 TRINITY_DN6680_c0_g1_i2:267-1298(+)
MDPGFKPTILAAKPRAPTILSAPKVVHTIQPREPAQQPPARAHPAAPKLASKPKAAPKIQPLEPQRKLVPTKPAAKPAPKIAPKPAPKSVDPRADPAAVATLAARQAVGRPAKLITAQGQFRPDEFSEALTHNTEFVVVGIIGPDGVGKTQALSLLSKPGGFGEHSTCGVDALITGQRVVLLDTQAVLSAAQLAAQLSGLKNGAPAEAAYSVEKSLQIQELQQTVLMLACCHVVIVLQDSIGDLPMMQLLRTADMLCSGLASSTEAPICLNKRRLVWAYANLSPAACSPEEREPLRVFMSKFFENCHFMCDASDVPSTLGTRELPHEDLVTSTGYLSASEVGV